MTIKEYLDSGIKRLDEEEYEVAIFCFDKILDEEPFNEEALSYRSFAKLQLKDYEGAALDINIAVRLNPTNPRYLGQIGTTYMVLGIHKQAVYYLPICGLLFGLYTINNIESTSVTVNPFVIRRRLPVPQ